MPRAVRFSRYGGPEVLEIEQVDRPRVGRVLAVKPLSGFEGDNR